MVKTDSKDEPNDFISLSLLTAKDRDIHNTYKSLYLFVIWRFDISLLCKTNEEYRLSNRGNKKSIYRFIKAYKGRCFDSIIL